MKINPDTQIDHIMLPISIEDKKKVVQFAKDTNQSVSNLIKTLLAREIGYIYNSTTTREKRSEDEKREQSKIYHAERNKRLTQLRKNLKHG